MSAPAMNPERFAEQARDPQVKMIEIKLSQGAKPGHGGVLPGAKVTPEIAAARGVPVGVSCISPSAHSAFSTPVELMRFVAQLRELLRDKPEEKILAFMCHWCSYGGADNAGLVQKLRGHDFGFAAEMRCKLIELFADAAANDKDVGRKKHFHQRQKMIDALGPFDSVNAGGGTAAVNIDLVARRQRLVAVHVDGYGHRSRAEHVNHVANNLRVTEGCAADGDLVCAGVEHGFRGRDVDDSPSDGERDADRIGGAADHVEHGGTPFHRGGDVEQGEFVGAGGAIGPRTFDGISRVADIHEMDPLDHAAILHVQTRHDPDFRSHRGPPILVVMVQSRCFRVFWQLPAVAQYTSGCSRRPDQGRGESTELQDAGAERRHVPSAVGVAAPARGGHDTREGVETRRRDCLPSLRDSWFEGYGVPTTEVVGYSLSSLTGLNVEMAPIPLSFVPTGLMV